MSVPVICVDGPSGSGKGTLARNLADELGFSYLDSGALYRIVAVLAARNRVDITDAKGLADIALAINVQFKNNLVLMESEDLSPEVRLETTAARASKVAQYPEIREALVKTQRAYAVEPGLVADGRDMGTEIFPQAPLKVFLTASAEERARRRMNQLEELENAAENSLKPAAALAKQAGDEGLNDAGRGDRLRALVNEIELRDERDRNRASSPLRPAEDAVQIDCTNMSIDEVLKEVLKLWQQR